ncbi:MAG: hypothetical protein GY953_53525, partial [bacterium]|nr:hypothetical protein [bacterium]
AAYRAAGAGGRKLFQQHDAQWIPDGYPGEGNILIFNNGLDRGYSTIEEIVPPIDSQGRYSLSPGSSYGPDKPVWTYKAKNPEDFYSAEISGAHRLPNGNTLICAGVKGTFFEVTPGGRTVLEYVDPVVRGGILAQGERAGRDPRGHRWNAVFKIHRYAPDYPGLEGRDLTPGDVIEQPASMRGKTGFDQLDAPQQRRRGEGGQGRGGGRREQRPRRGPGPDASARRSPEPGSPRLPWLLVHAAELDADHDGIVARQELLDQAEQVFAAYDRNQDGKLTAEEYGDRGAGSLRLPMAGFVRVHARELDSSGDGHITLQEMTDTAARLFDKSDKDRDGRLTPDEQRSPGGGAAAGARTPRTRSTAR